MRMAPSYPAWRRLMASCAAAWPAPRMRSPADIGTRQSPTKSARRGMHDIRKAVKPGLYRDTSTYPPFEFPIAKPTESTDGQKSCEARCQASALSLEGNFRRADERAASGAARRDLFGTARHPQEAHRAVPDLAERA